MGLEAREASEPQRNSSSRADTPTWVDAGVRRDRGTDARLTPEWNTYQDAHRRVSRRLPCPLRVARDGSVSRDRGALCEDLCGFPSAFTRAGACPRGA